MQAQSIQSFGKYQILERIASGGMAEIYKARLEGIGGFQRLFAIKRVRPEFSTNTDFIEMLVDEAKIAGLLSHANIVQILDLGEVEGAYYVAMEFVDGRDLGAVLSTCREKGITLPVPHAVFACIETLKGLEYAHQRQVMRGGRPVPLNIVHRDISPSNVLVSFQGEVKLTDFGIAKANVKALETVSGVIKGRFDYMSPEQACGGDVDHRADLFAAGVVLYEMLVGAHPFRQKSEVATLQAIKEGRYQAPSQVNPDVPYSLEVVLDQALARSPDKRFQSATAFKDSLDKFFHDAGFIFSHSTLAAFLKGLFPEVGRRNLKGRRNPLQEQETVPLDPSMLLDGDDFLDLATHDETDRPTVVSQDGSQEHSGFTESGELSALMRRANAFDHTSHFGPAPTAPDDATLIRKKPQRPAPRSLTEEADEDMTLPPSALISVSSSVKELLPGPGDDQATQVMDDMPIDLDEELSVAERTQTHVGAPELKSRLLDEATATRRQPQVGELESEATWAAVPLPPRPNRPSDGSPTLQRQSPVLPVHDKAAESVSQSRPRVQSARFPSKAKRTYTFMAVFFVCGGLVGTMVGFLAGLIVARNMAGPSEELPAEVAAFPPRLQVYAPAEARLIVDGVETMLSEQPPTTLTLAAGQSTQVRVELDGLVPYDASFNLAENELQILRLDLAVLEESER